MGIPYDTQFYSYDIFLKNAEKFKDVVYEETSFYQIAKELDAKGCLIWSFEKELNGSFSYKELCDIIPNGKWIDFLFDFVSCETEKEATFREIPLSNLFTKWNPYLVVSVPYDRNNKDFYFNGRVKFWCGHFSNDKIRQNLAMGYHCIYTKLETGDSPYKELSFFSGVCSIRHLDENSYKQYQYVNFKNFIRDNMKV